MKKILALMIFFSFLAFIPSANALACIVMSDPDYEVINAVKGETYSNFSFRVYNTDAMGRVCDDGIYSLSLVIDDADIDELFDYTISENNFLLTNGENKRFYVSLTPKIDFGEYTIRIIATRQDVEEKEEMSKVLITAESKIKINLGKDEEKESKEYKELPDWYIAEKKAEEEKQKEEEGEKGTKKQEKQKYQQEGVFPWNIILIIIIVIAILVIGIILFIKKPFERRPKLGY